MGVFVALLFSYAMLGMQLFAHVAWGEHLNADANFCSFATALTTMFRCATGEAWAGAAPPGVPRFSPPS